MLLACVGCVGAVSYGMSHGHSAVLLPQLQSENSTLPIDTDTGTWIGKSQKQLLITKVGVVFLPDDVEDYCLLECDAYQNTQQHVTEAIHY